MIPLQEFKKTPKVLILGNGLSAFETARQLISIGYEVVLINPENRIREETPFSSLGGWSVQDYLKDQIESLEKNSHFTQYIQTTLSAIEGFAGEFLAHLKSEQKDWTETVGAVVFAPELVSETQIADSHLKPNAQIITLEALTEIFSSISQSTPFRREGVFAALNPHSYIAFLNGLNAEGNVADMARTLSLALKIRKEYQSQVVIFCRQVKVAEEGMERLYQACRDEGVIFFKFDQAGPEIIRANDLVTLQFIDTILEQPFELNPDLLVMDSVHSLPKEIRGLALSAQIGMDESGFLQPANVHLLPQASKRTGIFIAGSGKGPTLPQTCIEEARAVALSTHHFFEGRSSEEMNREVVVDEGLCTICLTCVRYCPHQAIGWTHRIFIHPFACRRCGICAGECPMDAIQISGYSDHEVEKKLTALQERREQVEFSQPMIVIFGCQRSAGVVWEEVQSSKFKVQMEVEFIPMPCAGKMDPDYLLKALALGVDGVLVFACPEENCKSIHGNTYARERITEAKRYIEEAGLNPDRIRFEHLSSNMVWYLREVVEQFLGELKEKKAH